MNKQIELLIKRIVDERERQQTLPGSEWDSKLSVNDWIAIINHYVSESAQRKSSSSYIRGQIPSQEEFEDSLIKASAVILAALQYSDTLKTNGFVK